jgi:hypothetical protein
MAKFKKWKKSTFLNSFLKILNSAKSSFWHMNTSTTCKESLQCVFR